MFESSRVPCYLNGFAGHGDDPEAKELKLVFHIGGIAQDLAAEISPLIADRLFRKNTEGEWKPAEEITKASFANIVIPMQNIAFFELPNPEPVSGVVVQGCAISNLRATRPGVEARLEFDVVMPMDGSTIRLIEKYYKSTAFLTMEEIQREIEYAPEDAKTAEHQDALQDAADGVGELVGVTAEGEATTIKRSRRKKAGAE